MRRTYSRLTVCLILVSMFQFYIPELEAVDGDGARLRISYVVQPDRINVPHDRVEEYGYNVWGFQNDNISLGVYLTNYGNETAENVTATLEVPEGLCFNATINTAHYADIEPQRISCEDFSFSCRNVSSGFYDLALNVSYADVVEHHTFEISLVLRISDVGVYKIEGFPPLGSNIFGCYKTFSSLDEESIDITIKNGGNNHLENISVNIVTPEGISVEGLPQFDGERFANISSLQINSTSSLMESTDVDKSSPGESISVSPAIFVNGVEAGIYDLLFEMNYSDVEGNHSIESLIPIGIYDIHRSVNVSIGPQVGITKDFVVSSKLRVVTPYQDAFNISTSDFDVTNITTPSVTHEVNESIKDTVVKTFPAYLENSTLSYNKSDWLVTHLVNATEDEELFTWSAVLEDFGGKVGVDIGSLLVSKVYSKLLEDGLFNPAAKMECLGMASAVGGKYGENVFLDLFGDESFVRDNFVLSNTTEVCLEFIGLGLVDVKVSPSHNLDDYTYMLPSVEFTKVSDENSTFTKGSPEWSNMVIDNQPTTFEVNLTDFGLLFNVSIENDTVTFLTLGSSDQLLRFSGILKNETVVFNVDRLHQAVWEAVLFVALENASGVSNVINFTVTDQVPELDLSEITSLTDFLSEAELERMNQDQSFVKTISDARINENSMPSCKLEFEKLSNKTQELQQISLSALNYNATTDNTELIVNLTSDIDLVNITIGLEVMKYNRKYWRYEATQDIFEVNASLMAGVNTEVKIDIDGRFGSDFHYFALVVTDQSMPLARDPHGRVAIETAIGIITGVIEIAKQIADWGFLWETVEVKVIEPSVSMDLDVGQIFKFPVEVKFRIEHNWLESGIYYLLYISIEWDGAREEFNIPGPDTYKGKPFFKDTSFKQHFKNNFYLGIKKWVCEEGKNSKKLKVDAWVERWRWTQKLVLSPVPAPGSVLPQRDKFVRTNIFKSEKPADVDVNIDNPYYFAELDKDWHRWHNPEDKVWLELEIGGVSTNRGQDPRFAPPFAEIEVEPLIDKDMWDFEPYIKKHPDWIYKPNPTNKFTQKIGETNKWEVYYKFEGIHNGPHPDMIMMYHDDYSVQARGKYQRTIGAGKSMTLEWETPFRQREGAELTWECAGFYSAFCCEPLWDYGDAPDPFTAPGKYPSLLVNNGARHVVVMYEWLGTNVTTELDSKQVDLDEFDDGVAISGNLVPGGNLVLNVTISTAGEMNRYDINNASKVMYLNAWIDWNRNGDWEDTGEKIIGTGSPTGTQKFAAPATPVYNIPIPAGVGSCNVWLRFRLDYAEDAGANKQSWTDPNLKEEKGLATYGEVEDYTVKIESEEELCVGGETFPIDLPTKTVSYLLPFAALFIVLAIVFRAASIPRKHTKKRLRKGRTT